MIISIVEFILTTENRTFIKYSLKVTCNTCNWNSSKYPRSRCRHLCITYPEYTFLSVCLNLIWHIAKLDITFYIWWAYAFFFVGSIHIYNQSSIFFKYIFWPQSGYEPQSSAYESQALPLSHISNIYIYIYLYIYSQLTQTLNKV